LLISLGADINKRSDHDGNTALHRAVLSNSTSIVRKLVYKGCLDVENEDKKTAKDLAK